jgi:hypothetical protein
MFDWKLGKVLSMEVKVEIKDDILELVKSAASEDLSLIINDALFNWAKSNILKCPMDDQYCLRNEPCNNCQKFKKA